MTESVFSKVYSYRERENKGSKENFLIEIFGHCLSTDEKFLSDFLEKLKVKTEQDVSIKTQSIYDYGRPDLEINLLESKTCILIECKIEHFERENQLEDYKKILLEKDAKQKHLVYLTKYYKHRENENKQINFKLLRWSDIYSIINDENTQITKELKKHLKDENMAEEKNFNYNDITSLLRINETISKMNKVIDSVKEYYKHKIGVALTRNPKIQDGWYVAKSTIGNPEKFEIYIGFWWWDNNSNESVDIGVGIIPKNENAERYKQTLDNELKEWKLEKWDNSSGYEFYKKKAISQFMINEEESQIPAMITFFKSCIDDLEKLKKVDAKIFK